MEIIRRNPRLITSPRLMNLRPAQNLIEIAFLARRVPYHIQGILHFGEDARGGG